LLIARSERQAPRIKLEVCDAEPASGIGGPQDRRIDLFVDRHFNGGRLDLRSKRLLSDRQVCITRRDLAGPSRVMTRELFSVLNHVTGLADDPVRQRLDRELAGAGLSWHVGTQLPDMLVAPWLVAASDSTAILPARQAVWFAGILPIDVLEPPVPLSEVVHYLIWRQGLEETDAAAWVRGQLMEIVRDSMPAT
jgi:DNA-binding transcriptional LysR family regulator